MNDKLYELEFPAAEVDTNDAGLALVIALEGFADAGQSVRLTADELRTLDTRLVASFNTDELVDYRSRRPGMVFDGEHFESVTMPHISLHAIADLTNKPFLLLSGVEPDLRWNRFVEEVGQLARQLNVTKVIGLHGVPGATPHTRPATITAHGSTDIVGPLTQWGNEMTIPASVATLLEMRLNDDHATGGFTVHVPHYLAQAEYPAAAAQLVTTLGTRLGLRLSSASLRSRADDVRAQIDKEVESNSEIASVVAAMEKQYDSFAAGQEQGSLLAEDEALPTGDELGAELERYLAHKSPSDGDDAGDATDDR